MSEGPHTHMPSTQSQTKASTFSVDQFHIPLALTENIRQYINTDSFYENDYDNFLFYCIFLQDAGTELCFFFINA